MLKPMQFVLCPEIVEFPGAVGADRQIDESRVGYMERVRTIEVPELGRLEVCLGYRRRPCLKRCKLECQRRVPLLPTSGTPAYLLKYTSTARSRGHPAEVGGASGWL
jgi:hypothetical protein